MFVWVIADKVLYSWDPTLAGWAVVAGYPAPIYMTDMQDNLIAAPVASQTLRWDGAHWVNTNLAADDLSDVAVSSPSAAQVLRYNGSAWVNAALSADDLSDVAISSPATGQVLRYNGTNWVNVPGLDMVQATAGTASITHMVTGDIQKRLIVGADGKLTWGSGALAGDTTLYRSAASTLKTDGALIVGGDLNYAAKSVGQGVIGVMYTNANTTVASNGAGAETAFPTASWASEPTFNFANGRLFKLTATYGPNTDSASAVWAYLRVRKGQASVSGTVLNLSYFAIPAGFASNGSSYTAVFYVKNNSGSTVSTKLSMTIQRTGGTGNLRFWAGSVAGGDCMSLLVEDVGAVADQTDLAAASVQI
jgi:hypothetical protein